VVIVECEGFWVQALGFTVYLSSPNNYQGSSGWVKRFSVRGGPSLAPHARARAGRVERLALTSLMVQGVGFQLGFKVSGFRFLVSGLGVKSLGFVGFRVSGFGFRVSDSRFRV